MLPMFPYPTKKEIGLLREKAYSRPGAGHIQDKPEVACHTGCKDTFPGFCGYISGYPEQG